MFDINLYTFEKRVNSTKRPEAGSAIHHMQCVLRRGCSMLDPMLEITFPDGLSYSPAALNYAFIHQFDRFYFVDDWIQSDGLWTARLRVDVLSSWKEEIGRETKFVLRAAAKYDNKLVDSMYPVKVEPLIKTYTDPSNISLDFDRNWDKGVYVVGIISNDNNAIGSVKYYAMKSNQIDAFMNYLFDTATYLQIPESEMSDALAKSLVDPFQYVVSCNWFPWEPQFSKPVDIIKFGWWSTSGGKLPSPAASVISSNAIVNQYLCSIPFEMHPQAINNDKNYYLNFSPYTEVWLNAPPFGYIQLEPGNFPDHKVFLRYEVDYATGEAALTLRNTSLATIERINAQFCVPIKLSSLNVDARGLFSAGSEAVGSAIGLNPGGVVSGVANALASQVPVVSSIGANGSMVNIQEPKITAMYHYITELSPKDLGYPLMKNELVSNLPGYQILQNGTIQCGATSTELEAIKTHLESGFYYE